MNRYCPASPKLVSPLLAALLTVGLSACGGGSSADTGSSSASTTNLSVTNATPNTNDTAAAAAATAQGEVQPTFHMAPAQLAEPPSDDVGGTNSTARKAPQAFGVDASLAGLDTTRLTPQSLALQTRSHALSANSPQATTITGAVYTPAQIRAAYGLADLPASGATVSTAAAALLGAGQTIYVIDAYHDATALSDLNQFSTKFGLPTCAGVTIPTTASLPLAPPPSKACTFSVVYGTFSSAMTSTAPAYNSGWAPESKLDVQWAHAIAPYARIVLIELPGSMSPYILGGVALATAMGPGVVSMSFGSPEGSSSSTMDSKFSGTGMTFVAASGDSGSQVLWPAVSPYVLGVGGTSMNWSGATRTEVAWSDGGGGISSYQTLPGWQGNMSVGGSTLAKRAAPDVAFNADPMTGQYVALTAPGSNTTNWNAYGGTSIAAPQWAGLIAVANAARVAASKSVLGDFHSTLYASIGKVPGTYAAAFHDITQGANGTCAACSTTPGYDAVTGWGTPNASALVSALGGTAAAASASPAVVEASAPTVPGGSYVGKAGTALTRSLGIQAPSGTAIRYALSGAPSGLSVNTSGQLVWSAPVAGSYAFTATAIASTGKSTSGSYRLLVIPGTAPVFSGSAILSATVGSAFSTTLTASNPNSTTLTFTAAGLPSGISLSTSGTLAWAAPTSGTVVFSVTVRDDYGYSATRTYTLVASGANHAPTLSNVVAVVRAGSPFSVQLQGRDVDGDALTYSITQAPNGVTLNSTGLLSWPSVGNGTWVIPVAVRDSHAASTTANVAIIGY